MFKLTSSYVSSYTLPSFHHITEGAGEPGDELSEHYFHIWQLSSLSFQWLKIERKSWKSRLSPSSEPQSPIVIFTFFVSFLPQTEKYDYFQECPTSGNLAGDNEGVSNVVRSDPRPRRHFVPSPGDHRLVRRNCNTEVSIRILCFSVLLIWWKWSEI